MPDINPNDIPDEADLGIPEDDSSTDLLYLSDVAHNRLKALVTLILPAISTAFVTIAGLWGMDSTTASRIVGTLVAITTFLGVILAISTKKYNNSDAKFDGAINVIPGDGGDAMHVNVNPASIANKDQVLLQVNTPDS